MMLVPDKYTFRCLVTGTREFSDYTLLCNVLDKVLKGYEGDVEIVSDGYLNTETLPQRYAEERGYYYKEFSAEWGVYGNIAGEIRDESMHQYIAKFLNRGAVVFWDGRSKTVAKNFALAKEYDNEIQIVRYGKKKPVKAKKQKKAFKKMKEVS